MFGLDPIYSEALKDFQLGRLESGSAQFRNQLEKSREAVAGSRGDRVTGTQSHRGEKTRADSGAIGNP